MSDRKTALKKLSGLYKRARDVDADICVYCGMPRQALDHVPSLMFTFNNIEPDKFIKSGGSFLLYPTCSDCNGILGNKGGVDIESRTLFLCDKYTSRLTKKPVWSDAQLSELGKNLRSMIVEQELNRRRVAVRLKGIVRSLSLMGIN